MFSACRSGLRGGIHGRRIAQGLLIAGLLWLGERRHHNILVFQVDFLRVYEHCFVLATAGQAWTLYDSLKIPQT